MILWCALPFSEGNGIMDLKGGVSAVELFPRRPSTILDELTKLENMMPAYKEELFKVSKFIRRNVWGQIDDDRILLEILRLLNLLYSLAVDAIGQNFEIIPEYVGTLSHHLSLHSSLDISGKAQRLIEELWQEKIRRTVLNQWIQLDPSRQSEFSEDELYRKNLLQILDNLWDILTPEAKQAFWHPLESYPKLVRGRKEVKTRAIELAAPSLEIAEKFHILNRWTPHGKRYLYLVDANNPLQNPEKVCMEEMRVSDPALDVTIANFVVRPNAHENMVLNLDYEDMPVEGIFLQCEINRVLESQGIIQELRTGSSVSEHKIKRQIRRHAPEMKRNAQVFCGQLIFKTICSAIFTPLDDDADNDDELKERCYKSFHVFAEWCENKGFAGIRYPSTRMTLIGERGTNIVLFDADSAVADESTFRICRNG